MCVIAQDRITDIIEVRYLRLVEDDGVLDFAGIADDTSFTDDGVASDIGTVSDLAVLADDSRSFDQCAWCDVHAAVHPDIFFYFFEFVFIQFFDQLVDEILDLRESFPWIFIFFKIFLCDRIFQIK